MPNACMAAATQDSQRHQESSQLNHSCSSSSIGLHYDWLQPALTYHPPPSHTHSPGVPRPSAMFYQRFWICCSTLTPLGNTLTSIPADGREQTLAVLSPHHPQPRNSIRRQVDFNTLPPDRDIFLAAAAAAAAAATCCCCLQAVESCPALHLCRRPAAAAAAGAATVSSSLLLLLLLLPAGLDEHSSMQDGRLLYDI